MSKFKVGDKVKRSGGFNSFEWERFIAKHKSDSYTVTAVDGNWIQVDNYVADGDAYPFNECKFDLLEENTHDLTSVSWDYIEANRLEQAARDAIKAYNEYVQRMPKKVYLPMYLPD